MPDFTDAQRAAAEALRASVETGGFGVSLLDGVTGSGKTEVYFEAVAAAIRKRQQSLILMPEIALTGQFLDRFAERFGVRPAEWHSEVPPRRRARTWAAVADGEVSVVAGARSALFLPFADLGLIVVDEEHDGAYKQEDGVHYHARDMAVVRARIGKIPIVLSSATPSVESEVNARRGALPPPEPAGALRRRAPAVDRGDRPHPRGPAARPLHRAAARRGGEDRDRAQGAGAAVSQPARLCAAHAVPRLRLPLLLSALRRLAGRPSFPPPAGLPPLRLRDAASGRVPEMPGDRELRRLRAGRRAHRGGSGGAVSRRARAGAVERPDRHASSACARSSRRSSEGRVDLIIGTQLVAKGHHFPKLNLVGIVDADLGLANGDPRAAERTFQLLHQVAGRAGREEGRGYGFLQTHQPNHPVMKALIAGDREAFYASEIAARESAGYPPFGRLASLVISSGDKHAAEGFARRLAGAAPRADAVRVLGPAEAPLALVRGRHRFRLLVKSPRAFDLSAYLREWLAAAPKPKGDVRLEVDIDPMSFLCRCRRPLRRSAILRSATSGGVPGASSTQAEADRISAKPTMSGSVGRSPSMMTELTTPTAGELSTPSEAVIAESRRTTSNQRK